MRSRWLALAKSRSSRVSSESGRALVGALLGSLMRALSSLGMSAAEEDVFEAIEIDLQSATIMARRGLFDEAAGGGELRVAVAGGVHEKTRKHIVAQLLDSGWPGVVAIFRFP